jgi:hypothetical protein
LGKLLNLTNEEAIEHLREWAYHGGGPNDDDAPQVYEELVTQLLEEYDRLKADLDSKREA